MSRALGEWFTVASIGQPSASIRLEFALRVSSIAGVTSMRQFSPVCGLTLARWPTLRTSLRKDAYGTPLASYFKRARTAGGRSDMPGVYKKNRPVGRFLFGS